MTKYFKWMRKNGPKSTMIEVTKDYFSDGDRYINADNGWIKLDKQYIEIEDDKDEKKS